MERKEWLNKQTLPFTIIALGIFIRVFHYVYNRSLFGDEAFIAINFLYRGFSELLQPLEYGQRAPIGYLLAVELSSRFFGHSEPALRFVSVSSGILALLIFYYLGKRYLSALSTNVGLAILAFSSPLVYYSSELKQYMTELLVTVICYVLYHYFKSRTNFNAMFTWGICGALLVWFSFPSIFILAGIAIGLTLLQIRNKAVKNIFTSSIAYFCWAISFLINYVFFVKIGTEDTSLQVFWKAHFMPASFSIATLRWIVRAVYQTLNSPLGLDYSILAVLFFCLGILVIYKQKRELFLILIIPIILTLVASVLHKYPFHKRFLIFLAPIFVIFISEGATSSFYYLKKYSQKFAYLVIVLLLLPSLLVSFYQLVNPSKLGVITRQEVRPVIEWMLEKKQPGDQLIVNYLAMAQFRYYSFLFGIDSQDPLAPADHHLTNLYNRGPINQNKHSPFYKASFVSSTLKSSMQHISSKRLWVLFTRNKFKEEENSISYLNTIGKQLQVYKSEKAAVYLYQLPLK